MGAFVCSLRGGHTISEETEDELYNTDSGELETRCTRCGIPLKLKIDNKRPDTYLILEQ